MVIAAEFPPAWPEEWEWRPLRSIQKRKYGRKRRIMEHFASQGCCRLGQTMETSETTLSMETNNFYEVITLKTKMRDALP